MIKIIINKISNILKRYGSLRKLKYIRMRKISSYEKRETESKKIATRIGKILFDGTLTNTNTLKELNQNGLSILDFKLGNNSIKSIKNKLSELKMQDAYPSRNNYKKFYFENIPNDSNVAEYFLSDLSQIKEIIDLFNRL